MTPEEIYAQNQANAKKYPVATIQRPTMDEFRENNRQVYGYDGTHADGLRYDAEKTKRDLLTKAVLPAALFATGGAVSAGLMGGNAALPSAATKGVGFSAAPKAASSIPWGKLATAAVNLIPNGPSNPYQESLQQSLGGPSATTNPATTTTTTPSPSQVPLVNGAPPAGWDAKNWADPNMRTVKYDAGRLLYGATKPSQVAAIVASPAFQSRFPGATFDGKDKIDFKGALSEGDRGTPVGIIDVLMAADQGADTSNGLWWGFEPDGTSATSTRQSDPMRQNGAALPGQSDLLAQILASLQSQSADPQALLLEQLR